MTVSTSCGFRISMQLTVIILGEDCYGWEVHCLIRFVPLRVEIELASLFSAVMFFYMFRNVNVAV
jgi:hypothetical protein